MLEALAEDLRVRGELDLSECFIGATFIVANKGGLRAGKAKLGKGTKLMAVADGDGFPAPSTRRLLARMKSPSPKALSRKFLPLRDRSD